jgi:L-lactate dehydrogenase complex protein LldF
MLHARADGHGMIRSLPLGGGWTDGRDMPAPSGRTFRDLYAEQQRKAGGTTQ